MRLLRQLALAAAFCSLHIPVQSRALPSGSIVPKDEGCLTATCTDPVDPSTKHVIKRVHTSLLEGLGSIFERAPGVPPLRPRPRPRPDNPTVRPGGTPSRPGDPNDAPVRIAPDDSAPVAFGASKPGDPGFNPIGESKDPVKLRQKGQEVDKLPYTAEKNYKADEIQKKFNDNYKVEDLTDDEDNFLEPFLDDDVEEAFKDLGIAKLEDARFREMEVSSVGDAGPIAQAKYFPEKGIILGEARFSDRDLTPQDQKLRPSDITFLQWKDAASRQAKVDFKAANPAEPKTPDEIKAAGDALAAAEAKAVKTMRAFVGRVIASKSTVESMQTAQRQTGQLLADTSRFERGADTQGKRDAFDLMMGTDFISSLNHMLRDHAPALGKKQISSIVAYPRTFDGEKGRKDIAITVNFEDIP